MTLPIGSFDPDKLPQGVYGQDELGEVLQNPSAAKYRSLFAGRFPGAVAGTSAGDPSNVGGPLGFIVNLVAQFMSGVANEDPANITKPDDLLSRISGFFTLPALANAALQAVLIPLSHLLAWIVGGDPEDWDTLEELRDNLIPALIRLPLRILGQLFSTGSAAELDSTTANTLLGSIPIIGDVAKVVQGITTGLSGAFATAAGLVGLRWNQVDAHEDSITDLQDKTQALEGVIGYGCRYMSSSPGITTSPEVMPFNTQVGPAVGVTLLSGGRFQLDSKGLWRMEAQTYFQTAKLCPPRCFMDIVIRAPGGAEFTRLKAMASTDDGVTVTNVMPVVVPAAGYTAEVQAWTSAIPLLGGNLRSIAGGFTNTRFSVFKISDETS